jgi:hypothetical protein
VIENSYAGDGAHPGAPHQRGNPDINGCYAFLALGVERESHVHLREQGVAKEVSKAVFKSYPPGFLTKLDDIVYRLDLYKTSCPILIKAAVIGSLLHVTDTYYDILEVFILLRLYAVQQFGGNIERQRRRA